MRYSPRTARQSSRPRSGHHERTHSPNGSWARYADENRYDGNREDAADLPVDAQDRPYRVIVLRSYVVVPVPLQNSSRRLTSGVRGVAHAAL